MKRLSDDTRIRNVAWGELRNSAMKPTFLKSNAFVSIYYLREPVTNDGKPAEFRVQLPKNANSFS